MLEVGMAISSGDPSAAAVATSKLIAFKNRHIDKHLVYIISAWVNVRKVEMQTIGIIARNVTSINQEQECDI